VVKGLKIEWLIIGILLLYIIFLQQCSSNRVDCPEVIYSDTTITHVSVIDTIPFYDTIPRYITLTVPKPVPVPNPKDSISSDTISSALNKYETPVVDSLLSGTIISLVDGVLVEQAFSYLPKFPKYIIKTDSVFVNTNTVLETKKNFVFVGGEVGGNQTQVSLSPVIGVYTKKDYIYQYRYGLLDKTHNISISKRLRFKKGSV
jgi:hypothetical protein